jgi:hypothetical protein
LLTLGHYSIEKPILLFIIVIVLSSAGQAFAGAGNSHGVSEPVSKEQAAQKAEDVKQ